MTTTTNAQHTKQRWVRPKGCERACAEVGRTDGGAILIRHSSYPNQVLWLSSEAWEALRADIAAGGLGNISAV